MKVHLLRNAIAAALILTAPNVYSNQAVMGEQEYEIQQTKINETTKRVYQLESAVVSYFLEKGGFPTTLSQITSGSEPFFNGSLTTALGRFTSKVTGNSFELIFTPYDTTNDRQVEAVTYIAAITSSNLVGNSFEYFIPVPQSSTIVENMLNRVDASGNGNRMLTDLNMGNNDITDINILYTDELELSGKATATNLNATNLTLQELTSTVAANIANTASLADANFTNFTINGNATTGGFNINNLIVHNAANGQSVNADSFNASVVDVDNAQIKNINGDTATIGVGVFTGTTTTSNFTVDSVLETQSIKTDSIKSYKSSPVKFLSTVDFGDVTLNSILNANGNIEVNSVSNLNSATVHTLDVKGVMNVGTTSVEQSLNVGGNLDVRRNARIKGNFYGRDIFASSGEFSSTVTVGNDFKVDGALNVSRSISQNGQLIANSSNLYDNGTALSSKFLGLHATATDSDKLDNYDSTQIAQRNLANVFSGTQTFKNTVNVRGNVYVGGRLVVDSSGYLYDGGSAIRNVYATKSEASGKYSKWTSDVAQLRSSLNSQYNTLEGYANNVKSKYDTAIATANSQKTQIDSLKSRYASLNSQRLTLDSSIASLNSERSTYNSKLVSANSKIAKGPAKRTRSCTTTTTRTETGIGTGRYTTKVTSTCSTAEKTNKWETFRP